MDTIIDAIMPQLLAILAALLTAAIGWAATRFAQKTGIDIEARHREALHSALITGPQLAIRGKLTGSAATALTLDCVAKSVPDAIAKLAPSQAVLADLAQAKLQEADVLSAALARAGVK